MLDTIGPRMTARLSGDTNPNDIDLIPEYSIGSTIFGFSSSASKVTLVLFNRVGNDGPYMSASNIPTFLFKNLLHYPAKCEC